MGAQKGIYILFLHNPRKQHIQIGKLGRFTFVAGYYAYVGTACGPGGLAARLGRHARKDKVLRWHIDYIRQAMAVEDAWVSHAPASAEHPVAQCLAQLPGISVPVPRFGASDCDCIAHLFFMSQLPERKLLNSHFSAKETEMFKSGADYVR